MLTLLCVAREGGLTLLCIAHKGGGDVTFKLKCSDMLHIHPVSGEIKRWVQPVR